MKHTKRIFLYCFALLLMIGSVWALSACGEDACAHEWKDANCAAPKTCALCGATEGETGDHVWDAGSEITPVTCLTSGEKAYACTICDATKTETVLAAGHIYTDTVVDPTCLGMGYTNHVCACGYSYADDEKDALDHDWAEDPTCAHDRACTRCDATEKALAHSYEFVESGVADCENPATETYRCEGCGDEYVDELGTANGHAIAGVKGTEKQVSGCEYVLVYVCGECSAEVTGEQVYHHTYIASITKDATCRDEGEKMLKCSACGDTKTEKIEQTETGHHYIEGAVSDGKRIDRCEYCANEKTVIVVSGNRTDSTNAGDLKDAEIKLDNASIQLDSGVVDTIGSDTSVVVSADKLEGEDRDDLGLSEEEMAQLGDNPVYNFTITDGTEHISDFGEENYVTVTLPYTLGADEDVDSIAIWFINDEGELESIPAVYNNGFVTFKTNHFSYYTVTRLTPAQRCELYGCNFAVTNKEATCDAAGYTLSVCVRCHKSEKTETAPAIGHKFVETKTEADCENDGKIINTCENCGQTYTKTVKSAGHDYKMEESVGVGCGDPGYKRYVCRDCGDEYIEYKPQKKHEYTEKKSDATCVSAGETEYTCKHCEHSYKTQTPATGKHNYKDGVCRHCGAKDPGTGTPDGCTHEAKTPVRWDMGADGACGGALYYYVCDCGLKKEFPIIEEVMSGSMGMCEFDEVSKDEYENENGEECYSLVGQCTKCGLLLNIEMTYGYGENCVERISGVAVFKMAERELVRASFGMVYDDFEHDEEESTIDLSDYGTCAGEIWTEYCQRCGMLCDYDVDGDCVFVREEEAVLDAEGNVIGQTQTETCSVCGLVVTVTSWQEENSACESRLKGILTVYMGDTCILEETAERVERREHEYEIVSVTPDGESCHDGWCAELVCDACGKTETLYASGHIRERKEIDLSDFGLCGGYSYTYKCRNCGTVESSYISDYVCQYNLLRTEADGTIVYSCSYCGTEKRQRNEISERVDCTYTITTYTQYYRDGNEVFSFEYVTDYSVHEYEYVYDMSGDSCEDGVKVTTTCQNCDYHSEYTTTAHAAYQQKSYDLSAYGGCGGLIRFYSCACGESAYTSTENMLCHTVHTSNSYRDEEGRMIHVETVTCANCGLRYTTSHYSEKAEGACLLYTYYTKVISVGATLVGEFTYTDSEVDHDLDITVTLDAGADSCEDGVTVFKNCRDCEYSDSYHTSWHYEYDIITLDLADYGSVCGGTFSVHGCACGYYQSTDYDSALCDFDMRWEYDISIEGAIDTYHGYYTTEGYSSYVDAPEALVYICAVTDPVRCPLVIRRIAYYVDVGNCTAKRYQKWQIGYDAATDSARCEYTLESGSCEYHVYTETAIDESGVSGETGVCSRCGMTYSHKYYYDADGNQIKSEHIVTNPLNNGKNKRYEEIYEYVKIGPYTETSLHSVRYVYADGREYWYRYDYTYDLASCTQTERYTDSDGDSSSNVHRHWNNYVNSTMPSCTQDGFYRYVCMFCDTELSRYPYSPDGHDWYWNGTCYYCARCGLENANGADGDIIFEDLSGRYGKGTSYVAGYYSYSGVAFTYYVSLILHEPLENGNDEIVLSDISFTELTEVRAISFLKSEVEREAEDLGYSADEYDVRFAFVPVGSDGSFDYAITFTED